MITVKGKAAKLESDCDGHVELLSAIIKCAVDDAKLAKRRAVKDANIQFAEDWLKCFVDGSRLEREILRLSGLQ